MNAIIVTLGRTLRHLRRSTARTLKRLTDHATLKLAITVSLPPVLKVVFDYTADLSAPPKAVEKTANDNRRRNPHRSA